MKINRLRLLLSKPLAYRTYRYSVIYVIIVINVVLFVMTSLSPSLLSFFSMNPLLVLRGRIWTFATYMFVHSGFSHIFFNMLGLYFFGSVVEKLWGSNEFILLYGLIGVLSGIFSFIVYIFSGALGVFLLGASGAIYGVLLVFACMFPYERIYIFGIFPIQAKIMMIIFIGMQLLSIVSGGVNGGGVAYFTHLSGIAIAWIYLYIRHHINPYYRLFKH